MARHETALEMANLICRFGEDKVLADYLEEIVLPAFRDQSLRRGYGETTYFFYDVHLITLDQSRSIYGVGGRFIKDTVIGREQVFDPSKGLVHDDKKLHTAPSALFLLVLNNHRLLYVKETKDAPWLETFRATLRNFILQKRKAYVDAQYKQNEERRELDKNVPYISKAAMYKNIPPPSVELVPLASEESLSNFVEKYKVLKTVSVQLLDTNAEIDNEPFFEKARELKNAIGSKKTSITHSNPDGLDKHEAISQLSSAAPQGNNLIKLDGRDEEGDRLRGNNKDFQIKTPIPDLGDKIGPALMRMYSVFKSTIERGLISLPKSSGEAEKIIVSVVKRLL